MDQVQFLWVLWNRMEATLKGSINWQFSFLLFLLQDHAKKITYYIFCLTSIFVLEKKSNSIWCFTCSLFSLSGIMLNTWIAGVNQGEESSNIPLGLQPYQLCSFFLIRLRLLAFTSSSLSFCLPAVLRPARVLSRIPRMQFLLAFTPVGDLMRRVGKAAEIPGQSRRPRGWTRRSLCRAKCVPLGPSLGFGSTFSAAEKFVEVAFLYPWRITETHLCSQISRYFISLCMKLAFMGCGRAMNFKCLNNREAPEDRAWVRTFPAYL